MVEIWQWPPEKTIRYPKEKPEELLDSHKAEIPLAKEEFHASAVLACEPCGG